MIFASAGDVVRQQSLVGPSLWINNDVGGMTAAAAASVA